MISMTYAHLRGESKHQEQVSGTSSRGGSVCLLRPWSCRSNSFPSLLGDDARFSRSAGVHYINHENTNNNDYINVDFNDFRMCQFGIPIHLSERINCWHCILSKEVKLGQNSKSATLKSHANRWLDHMLLKHVEPHCCKLSVGLRFPCAATRTSPTPSCRCPSIFPNRTVLY